MQISKISTILNSNIYLNNINKKISENQPPKSSTTVTEIPKFAYRDINISFGERLFRTPENFYEQEFNQKNMPNTMREYLYADYNGRKNIPPALMMKYAFEDINLINSLDFIKRHYKNEPLFSNLSDKPKRNAKKGIISEVEAMKSETDSIPLFKDGTSNFGIYLLRKIYFDGKTLNEINKDFKKDLSTEYNGLITSDINYEDIAAYGIKFPKGPFWKSFTATREDFPYVYKPRKLRDSNTPNNERTLSGIMSGDYTPTQKPKKPRFKIKNSNEAKRMGDALINGHGDVSRTEKALRSKGIRDSEELSFVSKYLGEIMSIALEKTHASEEMRNFFENYNNLNKKQKEKLDAYWNHNPYMKELQSLAISDTIQLFFDVYSDGTNMEEFQELLDYANSIKPQREAKLAEHNEKQAYYDEIFANYNPDSNKTNSIIEETETIPNKPQLTEQDMDKMLEEEAKKNGGEVFTFIGADGNKYRIVYNPKEEWKERYREEYNLMPQAFINKCISFVQHYKFDDDNYYRIMSLSPNIPAHELERIMSTEEYNKLSDKIGKEFSAKNEKSAIAAQQATAELLISKFGEEYMGLMGLQAYDICKEARDGLKVTNWNEQELKLLETRYNEYLQPIQDKKQVNDIALIVVDNLANLGTNRQSYFTCDGMDKLLGANLREYPATRNNLIKTLRQSGFIQNYGGSSRILLRDDISEAMKMYKARLMIEAFMDKYTDKYIPFLIVDYNNIDKYIDNPEYKMALYNQYYRNKRK